MCKTPKSFSKCAPTVTPHPKWPSWLLLVLLLVLPLVLAPSCELRIRWKFIIPTDTCTDGQTDTDGRTRTDGHCSSAGIPSLQKKKPTSWRLPAPCQIRRERERGRDEEGPKSQEFSSRYVRTLPTTTHSFCGTMEKKFISFHLLKRKSRRKKGD